MNPELLKKGFELASSVIEVEKGNPDAKAAGKALAKSFRTVTETVNVVLLPLAAVNFGVARAKAYFQEQFQGDLSDATKDIAAEKLIEPRASVVGPAMQGLAYSHEEQDLKQLFLALIASSMNDDTAAAVHPSYVEIIKQLSNNEARLLDAFLRHDGVVLVAQVRQSQHPAPDQIVKNHIALIQDGKGELAIYPELSLWITNWIRLGLFEVEYGNESGIVFRQRGMEDHPVVQEALNRPMQGLTRPHVVGGFLQRTEFGDGFAIAVGKSSSSIQKAHPTPSDTPQPKN